jgi:cystathionine beta-lyase
VKKEHRPGFETICIHYAEDRETQHGAAAPPLYQCSTFSYPDAELFTQRQGESQRFDYTRVSNPTTQILERKIAQLEHGDSCRAFGSGMAAISAAILSCVKAGDHIITIDSVYGPTRTFLKEYMPKFNVETTFVRGTEIEHFESALRPNTKLIYVESPSSLIFELQDLTAVAELAKSRGIKTICDNSNATPFFQNPIDFGIDIVVHTATKYIGGHSDLVAGMVIGSKTHMEKLAKQEGELFGGVCDPFAAWLMLRGLRTLSLRLERHQRSAAHIARFLETDARIQRVMYSGLESHPQVAIAKHQMRGHSGLISFIPRENSRERVFQIVNALRYFCIAVSWGGYESLAIPHEFTDPASGKPGWLIRLSVGLESVEDLKADLYTALNQ